MLLNVLGNAAKFGREGGRIDVRVAAAADGAAISVADDGAGIALADPSALFEPFARGEGTSGIEGTGLGLPIVKGFMEAHGGRANIESAPGQGTKVTLHFPPDRVRQAD
jgi:two-component system cell cycle sensor histidine kinase PleC